jgi:hypothetical protein
LTDITPYSDFVQEIKDLFEDDDIVEDEQEVTYPKYTVENFLDDVYMSEEDYSFTKNAIVSFLRKYNVANLDIMDKLPCGMS